MTGLFADDPDIGRCDHCGSEEGRRTKVITTVTIGGVDRAIAVWLCDVNGCYQEEIGKR